MSLFADLDHLRTALDAMRPLAPEQEARVLQKFRLEWNYNSKTIEGSSLLSGLTAAEPSPFLYAATRTPSRCSVPALMSSRLKANSFAAPWGDP